MHVSVHIYKHLVFFFICCCKVLSPPFILTLLDHVVLVSSASTTNTREIKTDFGWSGISHRAPQKLSIRNKRVDFFSIFSRFMIFCLWFFVYYFCLLSLLEFSISIRKSTNTYIQYINVSIVSFVCLGFIYAIDFFCLFLFSVYFNITLFGGASRSIGADCDRALQILGYGFRFRHTHFLKFLVRLLNRLLYLLFIGSTKIVSHFLRNFVERNVLLAAASKIGSDSSANKTNSLSNSTREQEMFFYNR